MDGPSKDSRVMTSQFSYALSIVKVHSQCSIVVKRAGAGGQNCVLGEGFICLKIYVSNFIIFL